MKLKRVLLALLLVSIPVYLYYVSKLSSSTNQIIKLSEDPRLLFVFALGIMLVFAGHTIRAWRQKYITNQVRPGKIGPYIQTLLVGFLYNNLLPFRVGEIIRAQILGKKLRISASYTFSIIILERAIDGLILGMAGLTVWATLPGQYSQATNLLLKLSLYISSVGIILLAFIYSLFKQKPVVLRIWHKLTNLLSERLKIIARFKLWSTIYGLQSSLTPRRLFIYTTQGIVMWIAYFGALAALSTYFFNSALLGHFSRSVVAYFGVSVPSGPASLGSFQTIAHPLLQQLNAGRQAELFLIFAWALITIPTSLAGLWLVIRIKNLNYLIKPATDKKTFHDKLSREQDISQELGAFLDAYFSGNTLSHVLQRLEIKQGIKLIRYFKGGSNASTILVYEGGQYKVKKITPLQHAPKLKAQHSWLKERQSLKNIPKVLSEQEDANHYSIDLEYKEEYIPFFDFIHSEDTSRSVDLIDKIVDFMRDNVYKKKTVHEPEKILKAYIDSKVFGKVKDAGALSAQLQNLMPYEELAVNGEQFKNFNIILEKILSNKKAIADLSAFAESPIHGDLTVDNIIVDRKSGDFIILDPNDENHVSDAIVDLAKLFQSLHSGYEFLCQLKPVSVEGNRINFEENVSSKYNQLFEHLNGRLKKELRPEHYRAILFHEAVHYCRMLTYRASQNPDTLPAFYAVAVRLLNQFYQQYK